MASNGDQEIIPEGLGWQKLQNQSLDGVDFCLLMQIT